MSAYEYGERFAMWRMKGDMVARLSSIIAASGGMKKQSGTRFTESDFDPFAPRPAVESAESIDSKLDVIRNAHSKNQK